MALPLAFDASQHGSRWRSTRGVPYIPLGREIAIFLSYRVSLISREYPAGKDTLYVPASSPYTLYFSLFLVLQHSVQSAPAASPREQTALSPPAARICQTEAANNARIAKRKARASSSPRFAGIQRAKLAPVTAEAIAVDNLGDSTIFARRLPHEFEHDASSMCMECRLEFR